MTWILDIIGAMGLAMIVAGVALWSVPAAVVVTGGALLTVAIYGARRWAS